MYDPDVGLPVPAMVTWSTNESFEKEIFRLYTCCQLALEFLEFDGTAFFGAGFREFSMSRLDNLEGEGINALHSTK